MKPEDDPEFPLNKADLRRKQLEEARLAEQEGQPTSHRAADQPQIVVPPMSEDMLRREIAKLEKQAGSANGPRRSRLATQIAAYRTALASKGARPDDSQSSNQSNPNETLAEAEDRLRSEISTLTQKLVDTKHPEERRRITADIDGRKAGLDAIVSEKRAGTLGVRPENQTHASTSSEFRTDPLALEFRRIFSNEKLEALADDYSRDLVKRGGGVSIVTENQLIEYARAKGLIGQSNAGRRTLESAPSSTPTTEAQEFVKGSAAPNVTSDLTGNAPQPKQAIELSPQDDDLLSNPPTEAIISAIEKDARLLREQQDPGKASLESPKPSNESGDITGSQVSQSIGLSGGRLVTPSIEVFEDAFDQLVKGRQWSQSIRGVLKSLSERLKPIWARGRVARFTVENVLLGLLKHGQDYKDDPAHVAGKLASISKLTTRELDGLLTEGVWLSAESAPKTPPTILDQRLEAIFQRAEQIAQSVSSDKVIAVRHLVAAILLPPSEGAEVGNSCQLPKNIFPATEFVEALIEHVRNAKHFRDANELGKWGSILKELEAGLSSREQRNNGPGDEKPQLQKWDAEFAKLRRDSGFMWSTTLDRVLDLLWEEHSKAFDLSLKEPSNRGRFEPQLTPRSLFLASLLHGARHQEDLRDRADDRGQTLISVVQACGFSEHQIFGLLEGEFFRQLPPNRIPQDSAVVSAELEAVIRRADNIRKQFGNDPYIGTRHLFLAFLEAPPEGKTGDLIIRSQDGLQLNRLISAFRDSVTDKLWVKKYDTAANWSQALDGIVANLPDNAKVASGKSERDSTSGRGALNFGGTDSFDREASSKQSCMKVEEYANALRAFFSKAGNGELCFALYGHWGRGKTYLMRKVKDALEEEKYETVFFSAWKYPGTPEVWVHLYETIADHACRGNFFMVMPRIIRSGISKTGPWPLILALASLVFGLIPKIYLAENVYLGVKALWGLMGLGGLIWVGEFMLGIRKTAKRLSHDFLTTSHHKEKLGLQATIGKDLESVLVGWMPQGRFTFGLATLAYFAIVSVFSWSAWHWFGFLSDFLSTHPKLQGFTNLHPHPNLQLGFTIAATLVGLGLFAWTFGGVASPKRILLVIDDLDRCKPDQLLSVVESIKLLLEDTEVSKRVQVAMLVEEDILRQAVHKKYVTDLGLSGIKKFDEKRIVDENLEKLFTAHLRLPPLSEKDFREIFRKILDLEEKDYQEILLRIEKTRKTQQNQNAASSPAASSPAPHQPNTDPSIASRVGSAPSATSSPDVDAPPSPQNEPQVKPVGPSLSEAPESTWESGFVFSNEEKEAFIAIIPLLRELNLPWGPRSIRAFTFRYQLARLILRRLNLPMPRPRVLLNELVDAMNRDRTQDKYDSEMLKIIHQVS